MPGSFHPDQIEMTVENIKNLLLSNMCALDYWENNPSDDEKYNDVKAYYLRPAVKTAPKGSYVDPTWGGECAYLTPTGCSLSFDDRPLECQVLVPKADHQCGGEDTYYKKDAAIAFLPYNHIFTQALKELEYEEPDKYTLSYFLKALEAMSKNL